MTLQNTPTLELLLLVLVFVATFRLTKRLVLGCALMYETNAPGGRYRHVTLSKIGTLEGAAILVASGWVKMPKRKRTADTAPHPGPRPITTAEWTQQARDLLGLDLGDRQ
jgi:hypothetical protein